MASFDYTPIIAIAQELITEFGRSVTFIDFDSTLADANMPWLGATDPRTAPDSSLALDVVFVEPTVASRLGQTYVSQDLINDSEQILIVSPGAAVDLSDYQELIDTDTTTWKIIGVSNLQPGPDIVLAFVGLKR